MRAKGVRLVFVVVTGGPPEQSNAPRRSHAFLSLAAAAREVNLPLLITLPRSFVQPGAVSGWAFDPQRGGFGRTQTRPVLARTVLFDALYLSELDTHRRDLKLLRRKLNRLRIPFFNPAVAGKDSIYRSLEQADLGPGAVPFTCYQVTPRTVITLLRERPQLWLKPVTGSGGRNIVFVRRRPNHRYEVVAERLYGKCVRREMDQAEFTRFINLNAKRRRLLAQEDVPLLRTADGRSVDFRVTVGRDMSGAWEVVAITRRTAADGSVLTNYHAGGQIESVTSPTRDSRRALADIGLSVRDLSPLREVAVAVANRLSLDYPTLGLLGIDIGCTADGRPYVYDCNARPGRDILTDEEMEDSMRRVAGFARYLQG